MESEAEKKSCNNWNYGVAKEIIGKVRREKKFFLGNSGELKQL